MTYLVADSTTPALIPASFRSQRFRGANPYRDGSDAWTVPDIDKFRQHLSGISVMGDAAAADVADCYDSERYAGLPAGFPPFRARRVERIKSGELPGGWPKPYCSIAPGDGFGVAAILQAVRAAGQEDPLHWWIAWYTAAGAQPTAVDVSNEVYRLTGIRIDPKHIWGCQFVTFGHYDVTAVYQPPEFEPAAA